VTSYQRIHDVMIVRRRLRNRVAIALFGLACAAPSSGAGAPPAPGSTDATEPPSISINAQVVVSPKRPLTLQDIVSLRQIVNPVLSPDGRMAAFLVMQPFVTCNCTVTALYVAPVERDGKPAKVLEMTSETSLPGSSLSHLHWSPDGASITYLDAGELWSINVATKVKTLLRKEAADPRPAGIGYGTMNARGILDYKWAPDGHAIALVVAGTASAENGEPGYLYDDKAMSAIDIAHGAKSSQVATVQLRVLNMKDNQDTLLWASRPSGWAGINQFAWSSDSARIAFATVNDNHPALYDIVVTSAASRDTKVVLLATDRLSGITWSSDNRELAMVQANSFKFYGELAILNVATGTRHIIADGVNPLSSASSSALTWVDNRIYINLSGYGPDHGDAGIYSADSDTGALVRTSPIGAKVSDCDKPHDGKALCVLQSITRTPLPALVSLADGSATELAGVNPEYASIEMAPVRELHWVSSRGDWNSGYLITPLHVTPGRRVPLVVIGYGANGDFVSSAGRNLPTYPAQALARDGIAVLTINVPFLKDWDGISFTQGANALAYAPFASIQTIVRKLIKDGLVDPSRVGFMGHSLSGYWVQYAISHSNLFAAAQLHEGGTAAEPGSYWISGSKIFRDAQDRYMGGGPYGAQLRNYLKISASLTADKVHIPVLLETSALSAILDMEYFGALRAHNVPVDLFIYPDELHVFQKPRDILTSMRRDLDWFEYWLIGKKNPGPEAEQQYARWDGFRHDLKSRSAQK
jgi:dipeptidyl aminopeptidase/acylaminoacyl peptidase